MSDSTVSRSLVLAASVVLGACSMPAMADEPGQCKAVTINFLVAPEATPALLEMLRKESGATEVRVEVPGKGYSKDYRYDRLRVIVDENNIMQSYMCG
ncbi:hypothetical protein [Pseudomonas deceptionensis]|uniref:Peptidase inhibitor I78 family protein n=1 Tax=Pseudomonas deceptionensis TaxID=882211 RepID=A0A0J6GB14_PSEDM|nr:hypothetical protein [Pseudomonas deceptionensis]KMM78835.1 hypothetical protein TR67_18305 [Pseudomonas deceptionensis]SEE48187.1 Peptidase inhibitor I78 family protein [Pseudomonas deceptionensis]